MISAYDHPYKMVAIKIPYPFSLHPAFDPLRIELHLLLRPPAELHHSAAKRRAGGTCRRRLREAGGHRSVTPPIMFWH